MTQPPRAIACWRAEVGSGQRLARPGTAHALKSKNHEVRKKPSPRRDPKKTRNNKRTCIVALFLHLGAAHRRFCDRSQRNSVRCESSSSSFPYRTWFSLPVSLLRTTTYGFNSQPSMGGSYRSETVATLFVPLRSFDDDGSAAAEEAAAPKLLLLLR